MKRDISEKSALVFTWGCFFSLSLKTWTIWARSEIFVYADDGSSLNPKHEIRNPKQYRMIQIANDQNKTLEIQV